MISNIDQRIFKYTAIGSTWTDLTITLNDALNGLTAGISLVPGDFLYLSSFLPFNHRFLRISTASDDDLEPKIEVCSGTNEWSTVVDLLDYTNGIKRTGVLQWTVDYDKSWGRVSKNKSVISAMAGAPMVYDAYWLRLSWPSAAKSFSLEYVGQLFSSDYDLYAEYPVLQNATILTGWAPNAVIPKTTWEDQHILAATYITKDLIQRNIIYNNAQVLDIATLRSASVHKTANIIYSGMGAKTFEKEIILSASLYEAAMRQERFQVDTNMNARKDIPDVRVTTSRATR